MSDEAALLLILAGLHLMESCQIVPHGSVVLRSRWWRGYTALWADALLRVSRGRFVFLNPFDARAHVFVCGLPHLFPTADGVLDVSPEEVNAPTRRPLLRWEDLGPVRADESSIVAHGLGLLACGSPGAARLWARALNVLRTAAPARRTTLAERWFKLRTSTTIARRREERTARACRALDLLAPAWLTLLTAGALVLTQRVSETLLLAFLSLGVTAGLTLALAYYQAHAQLAPRAWPQRLGRALMLAACFPVAFRARSSLGREHLAVLHPLAAISTLISDVAMRPHLATMLRRWRYHAVAPDPGSHGAQALAQASVLMRAALLDAAASHQIPVAELELGPAITDPAVRTWCPRCHATYVHASGTCAECRGIALVVVGATGTQSSG